MNIRALAAGLVLLGTPLAGQTPPNAAMHGTVVARGTGGPLAFASITIGETREQHFTNDVGLFAFPSVPSGLVHLIVRRVGFAPLDTTVTLADGESRAVALILTHVVVRLPAVLTRAHGACVDPGPPRATDDSATAAVFQQLLRNAEQFETITRSFPFLSAIERRQWERGDDQLLFTAYDTVVLESAKERSYVPGDVVMRSRSGRVALQIPTLAVFTDRHFLDAHCFWLDGRDHVDDRGLIRVAFQAADTIHGPDFNGYLDLDPSSFLVRRSRVSLSKPVRDAGVDSAWLESRFEEVVPFLPLIAATTARNWVKPSRGSHLRERLEEHRLLLVRFTERTPGSADATDSTGIRVSARRADRILAVADATTGAPLDGVQIQDTLSKSTLVTKSSGLISLAFIPGDSAVLELRRKGYATAYLTVVPAGADLSPILVSLARERSP